MKPLILKTALSSLMMILVIASCKKSSSPSTPKTKTDLLTQGTWKFSAATVNGSDASSYIQACQKDNIYSFQSNGNGSMDEGASKCNSGDPQTVPFTWSWMTNETIIHVSTALYSNTTQDLTLVTLSETQLVVSTYYTPPVGPSQLVTVTFVH